MGGQPGGGGLGVRACAAEAPQRTGCEGGAAALAGGLQQAWAGCSVDGSGSGPECIKGACC